MLDLIHTYLQLLVIIGVSVTLLFALAYKLNHYSIIDSFWSIGFLIITYTTLLTHWESAGPRHYLITILMTLWGLRLFTHLTLRNWGKGEDFRYREMMQNWYPYPILQRYIKIFLFQGLVMLVVAYPLVRVNVKETTPYLTAWDMLGMVIFLKGLIIETIADYQLQKFCQTKKHKTFLQKGLWYFSRHPNYFGEILVWWGVFIITFMSTHDILTLVAPVIMQTLLLLISGVPIIEKKYENYPGYKEYQEKTNCLIPWFPKI